MDRKDPLLSHQYEAVYALSEKFKKVTVITGRVGTIEPNSKVQIINTQWIPGGRIGNIFRLYSRSLPVIFKTNYHSVFFHMTDLQCALLSPFVRFRGKKQYLWYAHTFKSRYLLFSSIWVSKIVTSTRGSCPLSGSKVQPIGQAIDEEMFRALPSEDLNLTKLLHIGRFDMSKNIELLIDAARKIRNGFPEVQLTLVGSPANEESREWAKRLKLDCESDIRSGWLRFKDSIAREDFPREVRGNGCFFHAYIGSLDKTLVESTMLRVPVVTLNPEYVEIFGRWCASGALSLESEYSALLALKPSEIQAELNRRLSIARSEHSLGHWVRELTSLLEL
jgi:glycosyltransferase involved in cell wall biosynthesis